MCQSNRGRAGTCFFVLAVAGALAPVAGADVRTYAKIADLNTAIPDGTGNFAALSPAQVSMGNVIFVGSNLSAGWRNGIYRYDPATGTRTKIVDRNTVLPSGDPSIAGIQSSDPSHLGVSVFGPDVSFIAWYALDRAQVITTRGGLHTVTSKMLGEFGPSAPTSMDAQGIAFGRTDATTAPNFIPGFSRSTDDGVRTQPTFQLPVLRFIARDGAVAYTTNRKLAGTTGAYSLITPSFNFDFSDGGGNPAIQPSTFLLPGQTTGTVFSGPVGSGQPKFSVDDHRNVVFRASATDAAFNNAVSTGIYLRPAGSTGSFLQTIADTNTIIPSFDGITRFGAFDNVAIDGGVVAFIGSPDNSTQGGIFAASGGSIIEVISPGDTLDGRTVASLSFSDDRPLSGRDLVFTANFSDGSTGLFLAAVPEPEVAGLAAIGLIAAAASRGRRCHA
jgi:hypothetical protein